MSEYMNKIISNYQTKQEHKLMSEIQIIRDDILDEKYKQLILNAESINIRILEIIDTITKKEISDVHFVLKPNQMLYDSICGLNCLIAGLSKSIPSEYLTIKIKDWTQSQGMFCSNYPFLVQEIRQIQYNLAKKRINILNIQEAKKYSIQTPYLDHNIAREQINKKLETLLSYCVSYCNEFYKINKYHYDYDKSQKTQTQTPQKKDPVQNYLEQKVTQHFKQLSQSEEEEEEEENQGEFQSRINNLSPIKCELKNYRTFSSYQQSLSNSGRQSIVQYATSKKNTSPSFGQRYSITKDPLKEIEEKQVPKSNRIKYTKIYKDKTPPKLPEVPKYRQTDLKLLEHQIVQAFEGEDQNLDLSVLERALEQELKQNEKEIKELEKFSKRLEWEEQRQIKKSLRIKTQESEYDSFEINKQHSIRNKQFKSELSQKQKLEDLNNASLKLSLFSPRQQFSKESVSNDEQQLQFKKISNLHKQLQRKVIEKQKLSQDVQKQKELVFK